MSYRLAEKVSRGPSVERCLDQNCNVYSLEAELAGGFECQCMKFRENMKGMSEKSNVFSS